MNAAVTFAITGFSLTLALLILIGLIGLVALVSPKLFARLAQGGSRWVDTNKALAVLDRRFDVDRYVLPFSRILGLAVLLSVAVLLYVITRI